jgi:mannose-6-phosphate isomerase-like protein (cupin superfamily)
MFTDVQHLLEAAKGSGKSYLEFLRTTGMSAGLYVLAAGASDAQSPHSEDEVYVVVQGRSQMTVAEERRAVGPGSIVFVEAGAPHRFHDIEDELRVLVFFAPGEGSVAEA